jgi:dTDP-4-amino-4,6-dideoxygalactose transaminase
MDKITARRGAIYELYKGYLAPLAEGGLIGIPSVPWHCTTNYHMFYVMAADLDERAALIAHLRRAGILAVFHYVPLHSSPFAKSLGVLQDSLPVTEQASSRLLRMPMFYDLTDREVEEVCWSLLNFYRGTHGR